MSRKARRRPSWKSYRKTPDELVIRLLNEEDDSLIETIRIAKLGHFGRNLIRAYGQAGAEEYLRQVLIDESNRILDETHNRT
jgi:hypothetical protein